MTAITGSILYNERIGTIIWLFLNLFPIIGVLFFDWNVFALFYVFWLETVANTFFNTLRILFARGGSNQIPKLSIAFKYLVIRMFILFFYLTFLVVFIGVMMSSKQEKSYEWLTYFTFIEPSFRYSMLFYVLVSLFVFWNQYVRSKVYLSTDPETYRNAYFDARFIVIHLVLVIGFFSFQFFDEKIGVRWGLVAFTVVFVAIKLLFESLGRRIVVK